MPWVNKIFLLVSNKEQIIESLLPENVVVVLHEQFIWNQYLPTFNSTTIEMFLWNIPHLSEYFIYANDDMLPTGKLSPSDFFDNGKIKIMWRQSEFFEGGNVYSYQCRNNVVSVSKSLNKTEQNNLIIRPVHSFTPMIRSHCEECFNAIKDLVLPHIRVFRTVYQHNQYIYPLYEYYKYGTLDSEVDFLYTELDEDFDLNHQIVCVNCEKKKDYVEKFLQDIKTLL